MDIKSPTIKYSDLDKNDFVQIFSVQNGLSEQMSFRHFQKLYLDENQQVKYRFKEWYDIMSDQPEEAWPDMEWLFVIKDEKIYKVIP